MRSTKESAPQPGVDVPAPAAAPSTPPVAGGGSGSITGDSQLGTRRNKDVTRLLAPENPNASATSILDTKGPPIIETPTSDFGSPFQSTLPPAAR